MKPLNIKTCLKFFLRLFSKEKSPEESGNKKRTIADEHSSYVKHILIPLCGFHGYHQTVSEEKGDENFLGREPVLDKLKHWLADPRSVNGAYLITGFRGMGKSSFVGKALHQLNGTEGDIRVNCLFIFFYICTIMVSAWILTKNSNPYFYCLYIGGVIAWLTGITYIIRLMRGKGHKPKGRQPFIIVKINVGNEILGNREILHLIVKNTYDKFNEYVWDYGRNELYHNLSLLIKLSVAFLLFLALDGMPALTPKNEYMRWVLEVFSSTADRLGGFAAPLGYILVFLFISVVFERILCLLGLSELFPFQTAVALLHRIYQLHERSIASVSDDLTSINQHIAFNLFRRKQYHVPSVHEMEQELVSIFAAMERMLLIKNPRFIIVLDELDKVDPPVAGEDKEILPEFNPSVGGFEGKNSPHSRQKELLRTLANMKYFMSTVHAKFVFIAGRDLYEAYLKDVSDREFSVSSIFNGVINVNSFLKPVDSRSDITSLTEEFVCLHLLAKKGTKGGKMTLKKYFEIEKERIEKTVEEGLKEVHRKRLRRNVGMLYQFVIYLVHVSNGSPKKISIYFEKYIRSREYLEEVKHISLDEPPEKCGCYLSFGAKDVQKIGFVHYVVYPVTQVMINKSKVYEDKLLVSTSFMINHIYKYHNTGFSWRNLEHIPELLEINKTPELRDFIGTIVAFLRKTHLTRILSGLYLFKFPMRISEEISFMSKQSEDLSALFNFSQDESRSIRKHYINLLEYYSRDINRIENRELHAMASIHHILGDLYQEDEDYSQAIFEYQIGLQLLSRQVKDPDYDKDAHWVSSMLFLVRNMLKLGLTYEKRKTLDSAYLAYSELVQRMVDYRFLKEENFGLHYQILDKTRWADKDALLFFDAEEDSGQAKAMFPGFGESERKKGFAFQCDHLKTEFARLLTPLKNSVIGRMTFFDDIRMAYLPILAKLSVLEKMNMEGITFNNLEVAEAEFFFLHLATDDSEKVMAVADFYNKFGDIVYYKNGLANTKSGNLFQALYFWGYDLGWLKDTICKPFLESRGETCEKGDAYHHYRKIVESWFDEPANEQQKAITTKEGLRYYLKSETELRIGTRCCEKVDWDEVIDYSFDNYIPLEKVKECVIHRECFFEKGLRTPCYACKYYNHSMNFELERMMGWSWTADRRREKKAVIVADLLLNNEPQLKSMRETQHSLIGDTLKGLGCVMLSCSGEHELINRGFLEYFFRILEIYYEGKLSYKGTYAPNKLEKSIMLFWEASVFYGMAGDGHTAYALYKHLIEMLNAYLKVHSAVQYKQIVKEYLGRIKKYIVDRGIMALYAHYDHINLAESQKLKSMYGVEAYDDLDLSTLSVSPDIEELLYGYYMLQMAVDDNNAVCLRDRLYKSGLMGPYKHISTLTQDVQNLRMKVMMNESVLEQLLDMKLVRLEYGGAGCVRFMEKMESLFSKGEKVSIKELYDEETGKQDRIELVNFLISDSLFCLTKIIGIVSPLSNTTLYTNVFMGEVGEHLWRWTIIFELVYLGYRASESHAYAEIFQVLKCKYGLESANGRSEFRTLVLSLRGVMKNWKREDGKKPSEVLKDDVLHLVGVDMFHRLTRTDQMEMIIRYYEKAIGMHSEGKTYKEMIRTLCFLDDDLNNDTCQLSFSIERFLINTEWVHKRLDRLKQQTLYASLYDSDEYFKKI